MRQDSTYLDRFHPVTLQIINNVKIGERCSPVLTAGKIRSLEGFAGRILIGRWRESLRALAGVIQGWAECRHEILETRITYSLGVLQVHTYTFAKGYVILCFPILPRLSTVFERIAVNLTLVFRMLTLF